MKRHTCILQHRQKVLALNARYRGKEFHHKDGSVFIVRIEWDDCEDNIIILHRTRTIYYTDATLRAIDRFSEIINIYYEVLGIRWKTARKDQ